MKKLFCLVVLAAILSSASLAAAAPKVFSYNFPKAPAVWGDPVSLNNLSPGFFQVMFVDKKGIIRVATYGIEGGAMDELSAPQLVMVFTFDKVEKAVTMVE